MKALGNVALGRKSLGMRLAISHLKIMIPQAQKSTMTKVGTMQELGRVALGSQLERASIMRLAISHLKMNSISNVGIRQRCTRQSGTKHLGGKYVSHVIGKMQH